MPSPNLPGFVRRALAFNREAASRLTSRLAAIRFKPRQLTTLSLAAAFLCAICLSSGTRLGLVVGAVFVQISFILDHCDGDLASLKSPASAFSLRYRHLCGVLAECAVWTGLAVGAVAQGFPRGIYGAAAAACVASVVYSRRVPRRRPDPTLFLWLFAALGWK